MTPSPPAAAIITAGGIGRRMGGVTPKQFLSLGGIPILVRTVRAFLSAACCPTIIVTVPAPHLAEATALLTSHGLAHACRVVVGGETRQESVLAGLNALPDEAGVVLVHDGVRPLVSRETILHCLEAACRVGAAICAIPVKDTLKEVRDGCIGRTVDRARLWRAQTPQAARVDLLRQAYLAAAREGFVGTDEASLLERIGCPVAVVPGSETNIKITLPEDIAMAHALLATREQTPPPLAIGHGYDAHRLVADRVLVLGGVTIPHTLGLLGHSDADCLTHALCDALLGAIGQGDLGRHFPDTDPQYRGISSLKLLSRVIALAAEQGFALANADLTVIAQRPKLAPFIPAMAQNLAEVCRVPTSAINIKATTTETMGFTGREEGIACHAVVLLVACTQK
jgi:2-C-methyl-D-erythritol 4-phosphate cytidylyltransferase/2-C-methyl-D-erythritol 2,4-cyclodiphosphate synthase